MTARVTNLLCFQPSSVVYFILGISIYIDMQLAWQFGEDVAALLAYKHVIQPTVFSGTLEIGIWACD